MGRVSAIVATPSRGTRSSTMAVQRRTSLQHSMSSESGQHFVYSFFAADFFVFVDNNTYNFLLTGMTRLWPCPV